MCIKVRITVYFESERNRLLPYIKYAWILRKLEHYEGNAEWWIHYSTAKSSNTSILYDMFYTCLERLWLGSVNSYFISIPNQWHRHVSPLWIHECVWYIAWTPQPYLSISVKSSNILASSPGKWTCESEMLTWMTKKQALLPFLPVSVSLTKSVAQSLHNLLALFIMLLLSWKKCLLLCVSFSSCFCNSHKLTLNFC